MIFQDAKSPENGKIAPNWNVTGTRVFNLLANLARKISLACMTMSAPSTRVDRGCSTILGGMLGGYTPGPRGIHSIIRRYFKGDDLI
jgi:hypothetical protein